MAGAALPGRAVGKPLGPLGSCCPGAGHRAGSLALPTALQVQAQCPSATSWPLARELRETEVLWWADPGWRVQQSPSLPIRALTPSRRGGGENQKGKKCKNLWSR